MVHNHDHESKPSHRTKRMALKLARAVIEAENELQYLQEERRRVSLQRKALRQLQKNEKRKKDRLKRKAAKLSRKDLLELALQASS